MLVKKFKAVQHFDILLYLQAIILQPGGLYSGHQVSACTFLLHGHDFQAWDSFKAWARLSGVGMGTGRRGHFQAWARLSDVGATNLQLCFKI
jgi:hypothetical protein